MKNILLLFILLPFAALSNIITVTSNADNGPGTLRQAIINAAQNGTNNKDIILFKMADTSRASRTILLQSQLPALSSTLVIDGSAQIGKAFGKSDAKIIIQNATAVKRFYMLQTDQ